MCFIKGVAIIKFQWLKDYQETEERIAYLKWNIRKTEYELERWKDSSDLGKVFLVKESKGSKIERTLELLENELTFQKEMQASLLILINTFKGLENQILKMKYVEGKSLETVAEELNYSHGHIRQKHAELRRRLDFLDDWEEVQKKMHQMSD